MGPSWVVRYRETLWFVSTLLLVNITSWNLLAQGASMLRVILYAIVMMIGIQAMKISFEVGAKHHREYMELEALCEIPKDRWGR